MNQCTHCQAEIPADAQFCSHCGTPTEESQTDSAPTKKADSHEEKMEANSKHQAVSTSTVPDASDATALPTLRTRRMHSKSPISPFPQDPWLPLGTSDAEDATSDETASNTSESPQEEAASDPPEAARTIKQVSLTPPVATPLEQEEFDAHENSVQSLIAEHEESNIDALDTISLPTAPVEPVSAAPTEEHSDVPAFPITISDEITSTPTSELAHTPVLPASVPDEVTSTISEPPRTPVLSASGPEVIPSTPASPPPTFPAPVWETPRPASLPPQTPQAATPLPQLPGSTGMLKSRNRMLLVILVVALVVLAGGAGAFALLRQNTSAGAQCNSQQGSCASNTPAVHGKPTSLAISGAVSGTMSIVAKPTCQYSSSGNLRTLLVNLSGTLNNQLYNFGFTIQHYNGPGTYSNPAPDVALLFVAPGTITNGWSNSDPAATGSITVERGEQTGNITYTLAGTGTNAKTQLQISGNWTCGS
ncbi:MAG TPA: zinc-ribbon domain-containing protein [Ktedonobacteraceae bacterium]